MLPILRAILGCAGFAVLLAPAMPPADAEADADHDHLPDALEQDLLARFRPVLLISAGDCDGAPSQFEPGRLEPKSIARNGAIYGQAFPAEVPGREGAFVELHYYHLWARDCGPAGHPLDIELVSALVHAPAWAAGAEAWRALYWYAAAHEDTLCDSSNAALATSAGAVTRGPRVWVSHGKHASFLALELCRQRGCGGDSCRGSRAAPAGPLINVGEAAAPLNGSLWLHSKAWNFAPKLQTDFSPEVLRRLDGLEGGPRPLNSSQRSVKAVILAGHEAAGGVAAAGSHAGEGLSVADQHTSSALDRASGDAAGGVQAAVRAVGRALRKTKSALTARDEKHPAGTSPPVR